MASTLDLPGSTLDSHLEKRYSTVQDSLKVPHFKAKSPHDYPGRGAGARGSEHDGHTTHSELHQPDIPCTEEKPGAERNSGAAWRGGNGTEKTSQTLGVNAGNKGRGISSLDSLPVSDCNIRHKGLYTHTRRMCFKAGRCTHTHTQRQVFSKPNCQRGGFQVLNLDSTLLSDHRKWKIPWELDTLHSKIPFKHDIPGLLCREGSNERRAQMRSCSPITTSVVFLDETDGLASECSKGRQGLEMEKRLRPLAENCFSPLLLPKVKTRK